ncbi:MAG: hypothetical protein JST10_02815 [Bacteroidetes bacterium]|nr:hypothetical protein [Bacteroidota bacterium]
MDKPKLGVTVVTAFLAIDYSYGRAPNPIAFETMIFGGRRNNETYRYSTIQEARLGHKKVLKSFM